MQTGRDTDRYWGCETHYTVAEQAIRVTVPLLVERVKRDEGALVTVVGEFHQTNDQLGLLTNMLTAGATRACYESRLSQWSMLAMWMVAA
ncbi:MAG: hypothetical protein CSA58_10250 [Micrococcales bacterium]|nr:MAG: hypothetical protein CSB46_08180 [Micrococcales bacterium]PIE26299.1 MAG: hypothetical protein CSA58_10250 [Micrococcales bacterium]